MSNIFRLYLLFGLVFTASSSPISVNQIEDGPLLLTSLIKEGKIEEARRLSLVTSLEPNITSYSGFITVDEDCGSNLYFWFFPSQNDANSDPVSLWLSGGPGSSSLFGLLTENGPYELTLSGELALREYSWNRNSSVIYIDNPVGTGFSFTGSEDCYSANETHVGQNLLKGLEQFFQLFPELSQNPFYLTGESYAGKYIPALAYTIHTSNTSVHLDGFAIGNGLTDPINQLHYSDYYYQLGLIDSNTRNEIAAIENYTRELIISERFAEAAMSRTNLISKAFGEKAGYTSFYNFLYEEGEPKADIDSFLDNEKTKEALHVGNAIWHSNSSLVSVKLQDDVMKSVRPWLEELLDQYRVLLFNGQMDMRDSYAASMGYIENLNWSGAEEYKTASREQWHVNSRLAGYSKTAGNFTEVLVRNAGHMVPTDQPEWALDLYNRFIFNKWH